MQSIASLTIPTDTGQGTVYGAPTFGPVRAHRTVAYSVAVLVEEARATGTVTYGVSVVAFQFTELIWLFTMSIVSTLAISEVVGGVNDEIRNCGAGRGGGGARWRRGFVDCWLVVRGVDYDVGQYGGYQTEII